MTEVNGFEEANRVFKSLEKQLEKVMGLNFD